MFQGCPAGAGRLSFPSHQEARGHRRGGRGCPGRPSPLVLGDGGSWGGRGSVSSKPVHCPFPQRPHRLLTLTQVTSTPLPWTAPVEPSKFAWGQLYLGPSPPIGAR